MKTSLGLVEEDGLETDNPKPGFLRMAGLPGTGRRGLSLIGGLKAKRFQSVLRGRWSLGFSTGCIFTGASRNR